MKKLTGALVLSSTLLLLSGCRSAGETREVEDASTPSGAEQPSSAGAAGAVRSGLAQGNEGPEAGKASTGGASPVALSEAERQAQESCLDRWLDAKKLDRYGHPEGTMYAGGSPLFNEMTGESRDRLEYVYQRQPEAKQACAGRAPSQKH